MTDILTFHRRKSTCVNYFSLFFTFSCFSFSVLVLCRLSHCHGLLGHLNKTEPSLMLLVTPVFFLLRQVKTTAVKRPIVAHRVW